MTKKRIHLPAISISALWSDFTYILEYPKKLDVETVAQGLDIFLNAVPTFRGNVVINQDRSNGKWEVAVEYDDEGKTEAHEVKHLKISKSTLRKYNIKNIGDNRPIAFQPELSELLIDKLPRTNLFAAVKKDGFKSGPLLNIGVIDIEGRPGSFFTLSTTHGLIDGIVMGMAFNIILGDRSKAKNLVCDGRFVEQFMSKNPKEPTPSEALRNGVIMQPPLDPSKLPPPPGFKYDIETTKADAAKLKQYILNGRAGEELKKLRYSTNDAFAARYWKLTAINDEGVPLSQRYSLGVVGDLRSFFPNETGWYNYANNSICTIPIVLTRKQLLEFDLSEICLRIRHTVGKFGQQNCERNLQYFHSHYNSEDVGIDGLSMFRLVGMEPGSIPLFVSNLSKFPLHELARHKGMYPINIRPGFRHPGRLLAIYPTPPGAEDGYYMAMFAPKSMIKRMSSDGFKFSDPTKDFVWGGEISNSTENVVDTSKPLAQMGSRSTNDKGAIDEDMQLILAAVGILVLFYALFG